MRNLTSRWFLFGLLMGWAATHATVFGQDTADKSEARPTTADKMRSGLDKKISFDYSGSSLTEALQQFRDKTGVAVRVDPMIWQNDGGLVLGAGGPANTQIQLKADNEKASDVLRKLANQQQLAYVILDGSVLITTPDDAAIRQMRLRVSVNVESVPLKKAVRELAKKHGVNVVLDPGLGSVSTEAEISLQVDNVAMETALRLLAEMAYLKSVRMGNAVYITSAEKAKKIQEEEQQQIDNPLNGNLPGTGPRGSVVGSDLRAVPMPAPFGPPAIAPAPTGGWSGPVAPPPVIEPNYPQVPLGSPKKAPTAPPVKPIESNPRTPQAPDNPPPPPPLPDVRRSATPPAAPTPPVAQ